MTTRTSTNRGECGFEGCTGCNTGSYVSKGPELRLAVIHSDADDRLVSSSDDDNVPVRDGDRVVEFDLEEHR